MKKLWRRLDKKMPRDGARVLVSDGEFVAVVKVDKGFQGGYVHYYPEGVEDDLHLSFPPGYWMNLPRLPRCKILQK